MTHEAVAIIGLAGRFPGAASVEQLWRNLRAGVESIRFFTADELERSGVPRAVFTRPDYVPAKGVLDGVELFDAAFFGFTPREAEGMDPQHRLFLECSWEALEDAGYCFAERGGRIGVFAGSAMSTYLLYHLAANPGFAERADWLQIRITNDKDFLTTLVSYKLNLNGPSVGVQTACSTSLVAAHLACQALLDGDCDMALAGGVAVSFPHRAGSLYTEGGIYSPDGHCRAFDAKAQGCVEGNGAGVVVLKRLSEALADGDRVRAVIRGSAVNNDGSLKVGYTAPSVDSQTAVILESLSMAGVDPRTIGLVEAHGSGTPLGDPIEVEALTRAFRKETGDRGFCALGSVKTNLGHLDNAAGAASLIKAVQALEHREIPPSLHCEQPNPAMRLDETPFYVNTELREWRADGVPRRAGVSSLGIGGTNAHLVLEEAPAVRPCGEPRPWQLLLLSAKTPTALDTMTANLAAHLERHPDLCLADVAHTLRVGRQRLPQRRMLVCRNAADNADAQQALAAGERALTAAGGAGSGVVFLLPGLGDQYPGMGRELYRGEPAFRDAVDRCCAILQPHLGLDLREVLYGGADPAPDGPPAAHRRLLRPEQPEDAASLRLHQTLLAQPAVFVVEYALAQLWME
ncbi:MAG TPA: type I polyketide synthase, partial [Thermoanaerobaculia bacterium]|nr:type I polyketide synthase [Thermoanaerobaculia bacterium]